MIISTKIVSIFYAIFLLFLPTIFCGQKVHIFGDSHAFASFYGFKQLPFEIHTLNGYTMHRVGRDGLLAIDLRKYGVQEEDFVIYIFGEIDVRNHIARQLYEHHRELDEIIDTLVQNYIITIQLNQNLYKKIYSIVLSVTPATNQGYNNFNFYGSLEERIVFCKKLNEKLAVELLQNNILFLNVYDYYATPEGTLIGALSDGNVHVSIYQNSFIHEQLMSLIQAYIIKN